MDRLEKARELIAKEDYDGAMREYKAAAETSPYDERVLCGLALSFMHRGQSQKVIEYMADATVTNPDAAYPHGIAGMAMHEDGEFGEAMMCYNMMLEADPGEVSAYVRKAQALMSMGRAKECMDTIKAGIKAPLSGRESHRERKRLHIMGARVAEGKMPKFWIDDSATFMPGLWEMFDVLFGPENPTTDASVDFWDVRMVGTDNFAKYESMIDTVLEQYPDSVKSWCMKGLLLVDENRLDEAAACYDRAIETDPGEMFAYSIKADLLAYLGDLKGALDCFRAAGKVSTRDANNAWFQNDMREVYDHIKDGGQYPEFQVFVAATIRGQWAASRRSHGAKPLESSNKLFPPGLLDGLDEPVRSKRSGRGVYQYPKD